MFCGGSKKHSNRLIGERSPYLLQHAHNPVEWYPWGDEAFERAAAEDKPVFLSVGYASCHWCHVMAKESFEDDDVARLLNESFISVKVDREERPDVDALYMRACQMLTGSGGWPLTICLTAEKKPFFAATYIPKLNAYGRVGMLELLPRIRDMWHARRAELLASAEEVTGVLASAPRQSERMEPDEETLRQCFEELQLTFDERHGGFGGAPKFPSAHILLFLLRYGRRFGEESARAMVERTLAAMRMGGIHDQVGGGFHRYATDAAWRLPHFEKMLYDQAQIALACVETWQVTGASYLRELAQSTLDYAIRDLQCANGGFASSESADSPGGEGAFYAWTMKEIVRELGTDDAKLVELVFGVRPEGNVEGFEADGAAANILFMSRPLEETASSMAIDPHDFMLRVQRALAKLFDARNGRQKPERDDKILADWNGLAIAALSAAARAFGNTAYQEAARRSADFVLAHMRDGEGGLLHSLRDAQEPVGAFAEDYAFMIFGLIELYQACFDARYLHEALALCGRFMADFFDETLGLCTTPSGARDLPVRVAESVDGALPSACSVQIRNLALLSRATGEASYERLARKLILAHGALVRRSPAAHAAFLSSFMCLASQGIDVILAADPDRPDAARMLSALRRPYVPDMLVLLRDDGPGGAAIDRIASFAKECKRVDGKATAYICRGRACLPPVTDREEALAALTARE